MKKKDIIAIVIVAFVSMFISYFLSGMLISSPSDRKATVEVVPEISSSFQRPDSTYFNPNAVNPTQDIVIQPVQNPNPFGN